VHRPGTRRARRRLALAAALLAGACQASPSVAPSPPPTLAPTATAPAASESASRSAGATGIPADEVAGHVGALDPGRYTRSGFEPRITFEVDGPWHSVAAYHGFFDVEQDVGSPDVIAVQFARPDMIFTSASGSVAVPNARAAADALKGNGRFLVVESSASRIGGLDGDQVTIENRADSAGDAPVLQLSSGALGISPSRRLWCAFFDTPDGVLAILVGGSVAKWDEALAAAEPVLESVTIGR
jgi:hypothetical protein